MKRTITLNKTMDFSGFEYRLKNSGCTTQQNTEHTVGVTLIEHG